MRVFAELMAATVQTYILAAFVCQIYKIKRPSKKSFCIAYLKIILSYFIVNYIFSKTPMQRIISGTLVFIIIGFLLFEGKWLRQILCGVYEYILFLFIDLITQFLVFPAFSKLIFSLPPMEQKLLGRNLGTAAVFIVYIVFELYINRKKERRLKHIIMLAPSLGIVQMFILDILSKSNPAGMIENRILITIFFSMIMIGGYLVVMELFQSIQRQQQKQAELEKMALERQYQYDYYQQAYIRSEEIRDMRHDMRNQLQTIQYLFHSEEEDSRMRAEEMVNQLYDFLH